MRILAIRGANLASLGEAFAIDFEQEPLRSAGLFAITGETGAGKSTILDALCLALYDDYPRVHAATAGESAPDPSGRALGGGDPRAILRRGAGRGFAEVDFIARDGERYRARCEIVRARGKSSGRLQNRMRGLWRIDADGAIIAAVESGVEPVNARIVALTDLSFDQFRRTALLAQGEFDAFLRADAKDRADLLEKITGSEIYGRISVAAHERARETRATCAALEQRRADIGLMTDAARMADEEERARIIDARAAEESARAAIIESMARLDALERARERSAQTEAQATMIESAHATARITEQNARAALAAQTETVEAFRPVWDEALALDTRIDAAGRLETQAYAALGTARADLDMRRETCAKAEQRLAECEQRLATARMETEARAPAAGLVERWREIDARLSERDERARIKDAATHRKTVAENDILRFRNILECEARDDTKDREKRDLLARQIAEREDALVAADAEGLLAQATAMGRRLDQLRALARIAEAHARATAAVDAAQEEIGRTQTAQTQLARALEDLRETRAARVETAREAARLGELAEAAAEPHTLQLRATLSDGAPCPVCGALEHPFAQRADATAALVEALRARRDATQRALEESDAALLEAQGREAALSARRTEAARRRAEAIDAQTVAAQEYVASRTGSDADDAPAYATGAAARLAALVADGEAAREALAGKVDAIRRLRDDRDALLKHYHAARDALDRRQATRDDNLESLRRAEANRAEAAEARADAAARLDSLDAFLAPLLAPFGSGGADLARDPESVRRLLEFEKDRYLEAVRTRAAIETEIDSLRKQAETAQIEEKTAAEGVVRRETDLSERRGESEALRRKRAALLDGEATDAHRARYEILLREAVAAWNIARDARAKADSEVAVALARRDEAARDLAEAEAAVQRAGLDEAAMHAPAGTRAALAAREAACATAIESFSARHGALCERLAQDDAARARADALGAGIAAAEAENRIWEDIAAAIGSASGDRFRRFAQSVTLDHLIALANQRLVMLTPRYRLEKSGEVDALGLQIVDRDLGDERRSTRSLSGGERFLASLALALALAGLEGRDSFVDTLFIDEGFGSLDSTTLDVAIDALETLQGQGRKVGVISHVDSLQQRIAVRISVERRGGGLSVVRLRAPAGRAL